MKKFALLLLLAPLALAACGGGSPSAHVTADPVAYVRHAAHVTASTPSEHMTLSADMSAGPMAITMGGSGDFSNTEHLGSFAMSASVLGRAMKIREILHGTTVYMSSPLLVSNLPAGKTWVVMDLGKLAKAQGLNLSSMMSQNPTQALGQLQAAGGVKQVGTETIDGVATTRYEVSNLDVSKLPQGAKLQALAHPKYGPIDVWIGNSDGRVYQETMSLMYSVAGQSAKMAMDVNFSKFGESVDVKVPPASETVDYSQLAGGGMGLGA